MPELPEIETTRRGLSPLVVGQRVSHVEIRNRRLRWPVPEELSSHLPGQGVEKISRRAKYLLLHIDDGTIIVHLGMSGSLRVLPAATPPERHDHVDLVLTNGHCLRLRDPRRFSAVLWTLDDPLAHPLLANLGPEPLECNFDGPWLYKKSRRRRAAVKSFIMDGRVVAGVGNIYANEALFLAGIHPARSAGHISPGRYQALAQSLKKILADAINQGGTTLRDFVKSDGRPGYFRQQLKVYGKHGIACPRCGQALRQGVISQRSSFYCAHCQR